MHISLRSRDGAGADDILLRYGHPFCFLKVLCPSLWCLKLELRMLDISSMISKVLSLLLFCASTATAQSASAIDCPPATGVCLQEGETTTMPDAPEPQLQPPRATFWTFGDGEAVVRTNREAFHDKTWLITQGAWLGAIVYDVELTHQGLAHHKCVEQNGDTAHPSRGELYTSSIPEYAVGTAFNYMMLRLVTKALIFEFPAMSGTKHIIGGTKWVMNCW